MTETERQKRLIESKIKFKRQFIGMIAEETDALEQRIIENDVLTKKVEAEIRKLQDELAVLQRPVNIDKMEFKP